MYSFKKITRKKFKVYLNDRGDCRPSLFSMHIKQKLSIFIFNTYSKDCRLSKNKLNANLKIRSKIINLLALLEIDLN